MRVQFAMFYTWGECQVRSHQMGYQQWVHLFPSHKTTASMVCKTVVCKGGRVGQIMKCFLNSIMKMLKLVNLFEKRLTLQMRFDYQDTVFLKVLEKEKQFSKEHPERLHFFCYLPTES